MEKNESFLILSTLNNNDFTRAILAAVSFLR